MSIFSPENSALRRAKTRKNLGHIPLNWLVELNPGFGPPSPTIGKGYIYNAKN